MKLKRSLSILLAAVMIFTVVPFNQVYAEENADSGIMPSEEENGEGTEDILSKAKISNQSAVYDAAAETVSISFEKNEFCQYVDIRMNGELVAAGIDGSSYIYDCRLLDDHRNYQVELIAYDKDMKIGMSALTNFEIPYRTAGLDEVDVDYSLEQKVLEIDWDGDNIAYVDIYQDDVLIAEKAPSEKLTEGKYVINNWVLEVKSIHTYRIIPYNAGKEMGVEKVFVLEVDDYVAKVESADAEYNELTKQIVMQWSTVYTDYVTIYLNNEVLESHYTENSFVMDCFLQPGADYKITIEPYNSNNEEGNEETVDISYGYFDVPDEPNLSLMGKPVKTSSGNYTGFTKPVVHVEWFAQANAVYEIYRARKDKKSDYHWIANVKPEAEGDFVYIDEKVDFETYYYKVRRKVTKDKYVEQALLTALSNAAGIKVVVPKPQVKAELTGDSTIRLSMDSKKDFVSGYDIYRKAGTGSYKKLATITEDEYIDKDIKFNETYSYKVKAYYYDVEKDKRNTGKFSGVSKVKNIVSSISAQAAAASEDTVRLTWTPVANVKTYEVYCKSNTQGDSYVLIGTTKKLSFKHKVSKSGRYYFMIKACHTASTGKDYFVSTEVSLKMGFSAPYGVKVSKTSYKADKASNTLIQQDTLSWNRVYGAKGYEIEVMNPVTKKYKRVARVKSETKTSYTVSNPVVAGAPAVRYRINAYAGKSKKKGDTIDVLPVLAAPKGVKAVKSGNKVKISWKGVVGVEVYRVYRSNGRTMLLLGEPNSTSFIDAGASAGITFQYYVEAANYSLNLVSEKSRPADFTAQLDKISSLKADNGKNGAVRLKWKALNGVKKYIIYYKASNGANYEKIAEVSGKQTSYEHKNPVKGSTGYYKVAALQMNGGGILIESKSAYTTVRVN